MGERSVSPEQRCLLSLLGSPGLGNIFGMFQKRRLRRFGSPVTRQCGLLENIMFRVTVRY